VLQGLTDIQVVLLLVEMELMEMPEVEVVQDLETVGPLQNHLEMVESGALK
jgi:hypothetical protein